jgi:hypothetical protein
MKNDSRTRRAHTREEIFDWIRRYRASGLALGTFAEQHGLARNRLHYWVYDRRYCQAHKPVAAASGFQELKLTAGLPAQTWAAEIRLATGPVVRFSTAATPAWMDSVLVALRRPC